MLSRLTVTVSDAPASDGAIPVSIAWSVVDATSGVAQTDVEIECGGVIVDEPISPMVLRAADGRVQATAAGSFSGGCGADRPSTSSITWMFCSFPMM